MMNLDRMWGDGSAYVPAEKKDNYYILDRLEPPDTKELSLFKIFKYN
jgi:hypothetical protein